MKLCKAFLVLLALTFALPFSASAENDWAIVIDGFPKDIGTTVSPDLWSPYAPLFQMWNFAISVDSTIMVSITAYADATRYALNHDLKNAAIAASRYNALADYLVNVIGIPRSRILPIKTGEFKEKGPKYRRVEISLIQKEIQLQPLAPQASKPQVDTIYSVKVIEKQTINNFFSFVELGAGFSIRSHGKPTIVARGRIGNQTICFDVEFGISSATKRWELDDQMYDTHLRLIAGHVAYAPFDSNQIELIVGWERNEERINSFARYVMKREGPVLGIGYTYQDFLNIRAFWSPSEEDQYFKRTVNWDYNQFRIAVYITKIWR